MLHALIVDLRPSLHNMQNSIDINIPDKQLLSAWLLLFFMSRVLYLHGHMCAVDAYFQLLPADAVR